jgi:hypothetical protein
VAIPNSTTSFGEDEALGQMSRISQGFGDLMAITSPKILVSQFHTLDADGSHHLNANWQIAQ